MIGHEFPYLDTRDLNLDWLIRTVKQLKGEWENFTPAMQEFVNNWLDAHPEATTTVQDNSITKDKLFRNVASKYILTPDDYEGTDTEKLQACLDKLAETGGTIVINRKYTLDGNLVDKLNSNSNIHIEIIGLGESAEIDFSAYSFTGVTDDLTGGLWFFNLKLTGTGVAFKCAKLIRLKFLHCYFTNFAKVFEDGSENTAQILQSIYVDQCYFRNITTALFYAGTNAVYDIHFTNSVMESGGTFFISTGIHWIAGLFVENNCIEGINTVFKTSLTQSIFQAVFRSNYFELNTNYFDLSDCRYIANLSIENNFFAESIEKALITLPASVKTEDPATGALTVKNNTLADSSARTYLFGLPASPVRGNYTAVRIEDNRLDNLTYRNTYNSYLPYKNFKRLMLEYAGSTIEDFAQNMADDLIKNQPVCTESYSLTWTGQTFFSAVFAKTSDTTAVFILYNHSLLYTGRYNNGSITPFNRYPLASELSGYVPFGNADSADNALTPGLYVIGSAVYLVMRLDSNFIAQIRMNYNTTYIEYRSRINGTWQNWRRLTGTEVV